MSKEKEFVDLKESHSNNDRVPGVNDFFSLRLPD
jgi:hypothetical protein